MEQNSDPDRIRHIHSYLLLWKAIRAKELGLGSAYVSFQAQAQRLFQRIGKTPTVATRNPRRQVFPVQDFRSTLYHQPDGQTHDDGYGHGV